MGHHHCANCSNLNGILFICASLITFATSGNIDYSKGIAGAAGLGIGSFIGATFATKKGAKLIQQFQIPTNGQHSQLLSDELGVVCDMQ